MAALTAALIAATALQGVQTYHALTSKPVAPPELPQLPTMPDTTADAKAAEKAAKDAAALERRKAQQMDGRAATLLTGPQGLTSQAPVQRKTLLGQ